jgi:SAM-dependent methyltransferase
VGISDVVRSGYWRTRGHYRPLPERFYAPLADADMLEVGGPSGLFSTGGLVPVYVRAARVDNVQFASTTHWHDLDSETTTFTVDGAALGRQFIADDLDLPWIADATYDAVISSHVIEHFANPLRALAAWRRVTRPDGLLLMVAPHHEGTFDRRRPVTSLDHIIEDARAGTGEDDLTHLEETLQLHDFGRDAPHDQTV